MYYSLLPNRQLLRLSGEDTVSFLQGLLTNDMAGLEERGITYAALLSPQGKFLHDMFVLRWQGAFWIDCDANRMADLRQRLMLYRLRSKVAIEPAPEWMGIAVLWDGAPLSPANDDILAVQDPRLDALGWRLAGNTQTLAEWCAAQQAVQADRSRYEQWRISLGVPDGVQDMVIDKSLLLEFGFDALHGVDFKKGCYVGQEVTARSKFRAQLKKALYRVEADTGTLPPAGTEIRAGETRVGEMRSSRGSQGLALLRIEELEQARAQQMPLTADGLRLTAQVPEWIKASSAA